MTKTFKKSKPNDKFVGVIPFEFDDGDKGEDDKVAVPNVIHLIPIGEWAHNVYGPIIINNSDIREFAQNFNAEIRKGVYITAGHEGFEELPAVGWIKKVEMRDDGLWGEVEWNEYGMEALQDKQWKFFSPELCRDYEDPETHDLYRNVLTGGALTKSPYFKELTAIVFSDKNISNNFNQTMPKTLEEVLALDVTTLTDEDKKVLKDNADKLTEEQKVTYADVIKVEEAPAETEEEKKTREDKEAENIAAGLNADGTPKEEEPAPAEVVEPVVETPVVETEKIEMSEKNGIVSMSKMAFSLLEKKANEGAQAFKELEASKLESAVASLTFSDSNKSGRFLPKSKDNLRAFMGKLNADQKKAFSDLIASLPKNQVFSEEGDGGKEVDASVETEVEAKVNEVMKANDKLSYSEALKQVMSENAGLEEKYDRSLKGTKKVEA